METFGILVWHLGRKTLGRTELVHKVFTASSSSLYTLSFYFHHACEAVAHLARCGEPICFFYCHFV
jgi:hypothetical protein